MPPYDLMGTDFEDWIKPATLDVYDQIIDAENAGLTVKALEPDECELVEKYQELDDRGKETVQTIATLEFDRIKK